ncbi:Fic family protein [Paramicrobacterium fandaimingii]|uniref:Fic family protein n=1 Tax=Paramicrobacterium fandaimingii TaxID=2708079 RepID=UPI00141E2391|nr:Fic/DOC family N-terminal domain-containing protein [Microbacterium fandaimingii]
MKANDFSSSRFGEVTRNPISSWTYPYFLPTEIPRTLEFSSVTAQALSRADIALGRLDGLGQLVDDPDLLLGPSMLQEAVSSSRIEGTQASLSDVLAAESSGEEIHDDDVLEVLNYLNAARQGVELLQTLPLTQRLFCAVHATLMTGVRGDEKRPGELRASPVWIGGAGAGPQNAAFVPPIQEHIGSLLTDWERFANEEPTTTPVARSALLHYQFETIHPFLDGNGRVGRLLIGFGLIHDRVLASPILHIAGYFERHRDEYYARLMGVRQRGEIEEWVSFFAEGVATQADESAQRIRTLVTARERYRRQAYGDRSTLPGLIDVIFVNPLVTTSAVMRALEVSQPTASALLRKAEERGWVESLGRRGRGGRGEWIAREIWDAVASPLDR